MIAPTGIFRCRKRSVQRILAAYPKDDAGRDKTEPVKGQQENMGEGGADPVSESLEKHFGGGIAARRECRQEQEEYGQAQEDSGHDRVTDQVEEAGQGDHDGKLDGYAYPKRTGSRDGGRRVPWPNGLAYGRAE